MSQLLKINSTDPNSDIEAADSAQFNSNSFNTEDFWGLIVKNRPSGRVESKKL